MCPLAARPVHPGRILRLEMVARNVTVTDLAQRTGIDKANISHMLAGRRRINVHHALAFEHVLCPIEAGFWLRLQADYDLWHARHTLQRAQERAQVSVGSSGSGP